MNKLSTMFFALVCACAFFAVSCEKVIPDDPAGVLTIEGTQWRSAERVDTSAAGEDYFGLIDFGVDSLGKFCSGTFLLMDNVAIGSRKNAAGYADCTIKKVRETADTIYYEVTLKPEILDIEVTSEFRVTSNYSKAIIYNGGLPMEELVRVKKPYDLRITMPEMNFSKTQWRSVAPVKFMNKDGVVTPVYNVLDFSLSKNGSLTTVECVMDQGTFTKVDGTTPSTINRYNLLHGSDSIGDFWSILNVSNNSEMRFYPNYPQTSLTLNFYQNSSLEDSFAFIRVENPSAIAGLN